MVGTHIRTLIVCAYPIGHLQITSYRELCNIEIIDASSYERCWLSGGQADKLKRSVRLTTVDTTLEASLCSQAMYAEMVQWIRQSENGTEIGLLRQGLELSYCILV